VTVEGGARVRQSVIGAGVRIPADARIERSVVVRRDVVHQMERGEIVGENVIVAI
jgi:NDP-sugar pyrophosphorylase family protein